MNRKISFFGLGFLGTLGLCNLARCINENDSQGLEEKIEFSEVESRSRFEADAWRLNETNSDYRLTAEELIYLARLLYFEEGTFIPENKSGLTEEDIRTGYEGVAFVLLNRFDFDNENNTNKFHSRRSNGSLITFAKYDNAFSCLKNRKKYFERKTFRDENESLTLMFDGVQSRDIENAYNALIEVLSEEANDPTEGALYYKVNPKRVKVEIPVWHGTEAFWLNGKSCKIDWNVDITNHQYYGVNCNVD